MTNRISETEPHLPDSAVLAQVRRLEAISFRSFPATSTHYDGTWAIRLTAGHPAKRLNSVNPLDPRDTASLAQRLEMAKHRFDSFGRPFIVRQSPLTPTELVDLMDQEGWDYLEESLVMVADLSRLNLDGGLDYLPVQDVGLWVDCFLTNSGASLDLKPGLVEVISSIEGENGLFVTQDKSGPVGAARCVRESGLVGLFDLVTAPDHQRQGRGRQLVKAALKWARGKGAIVGWLQVVANNEAAIRLYESLGFEELYRYVYRTAPDAGASISDRSIN